MAFAQLTYRESLRDIECCLRAMKDKLYHMGIRGKVSRSTIAYANENRDWRIYCDFAQILIHQARQLYADDDFGLQLQETVYALDATIIDLSLKLFPWARFRKTKSAVRMHTLLQADGLLPTFLIITDGKTHESGVARQMNIPTDSYVAIDRGYHDFTLYSFFKDNNIRFVTRARSNAKYKVLKRNTSNIIRDEIIEFTGYYSHKNYPYPLRLIHYFDPESNKTLTFLTNDFDNDAKTIADIYKARWEIEIFFRTIKQNLKIKRFFGTTPNAVFTQIWIAMIAYLLVSLHKFLYKSKFSVQKIMRLIQVNIFERKDVKEIFKEHVPKPPGKKIPNQLCLFNF